MRNSQCVDERSHGISADRIRGSSNWGQGQAPCEKFASLFAPHTRAPIEAYDADILLELIVIKTNLVNTKLVFISL